MPRATMGSFSEYRVTIGERTYVAVVSFRGRVVRGDAPSTASSVTPPRT
jgi:hypothetical protein